MADNVVETTGEDTTTAAEGEADVAEDFESTEDEFRSLYERCESEAAAQKQLAMKLSSNMPETAEALRQVAGNVYPLLQEVIATCGGAFASLEDRVDEESEGGVGLTEEDAVDFTRTLVAFGKLVKELREAATDEPTKERLDALTKMGDEMQSRVLELADMDEGELQKALEESSAETQPEPTEVN